jgi:hypothetical protein
MAAAAVLEGNRAGPVALEVLHGEAGSGSACDGFTSMPSPIPKAASHSPNPNRGPNSPDGQFALSRPRNPPQPEVPVRVPFERAI